MDDLPAGVARMVELYSRTNRYGADNGMELQVEAPGRATYRMTVQEKHLSSPRTCHGGVLAGLMDATIGAAALSEAFTEERLVSTVEFKMNYLNPVYLGDVLEASGQVEYKGKRLITSSGTIRRISGDEQMVARGLGTFNAYPLSKHAFAEAVEEQMRERE